MAVSHLSVCRTKYRLRHGLNPAGADAAVKVIAGGSQHNTRSAISHRIAGLGIGIGADKLGDVANRCLPPRKKGALRRLEGLSVHLWAHEITNVIDEVYREGSKLFGDILRQIMIGVKFNA